MRICKDCKIEKDLSLFDNFMSKGKYLSYRTDCKECRNAKRRKGRSYSDNRDQFKHKQWRRLILERDNNKCQICASDENLVAHHIIEWDDNIELRFDLSNGQTLCRGCHMRHHKNSKGHEQIPWNKGLKTGIGGTKKGTKFTEEHKEKLSAAKKGKPSWNVGIPMREETKDIFRKRIKGKSWIVDPDTGKRKWVD